MFQLRLVQCELGGFATLGHSRVVSLTPAFNLIVGDPGSGKTTLVAAMVDAFCGPSQSTAGQFTRLSFSTPAGEVLEVRVDWSTPLVQLAQEEGSPLFESRAWSGLLDFIEKRTGLAGLAASCLLSAEDFGWSLPAGVAALVAPGAEEAPEAARHRELEEQRRDLADKRTQVESLQRQMRELKTRHEHHINRFRTVPDGFAQWLGTLIQARREVQRLQAEESVHQEQVRQAREELEQLRASLDEKYGAYRKLGPEFPERLREYRKLETTLGERRRHVEALQARLAEARDRVAAAQVPVADLPPDFETRLASLPVEADDGTADQSLERTWQEAIDRLAAARFDTAADDFPARLDELASARQELARVQGALEEVQVRLHTMGFEGARHQEAVHWPDDFPDRLGQLRRQQQADSERLAALEATLVQRQAAEVKVVFAQQALAVFDGLHEAPSDFQSRVEALIAGRKLVSDSVASLEEQKRRMGEIETILAAEYDQFKDIGDDYPAQLEQVGRHMVQIGVQRKVFDDSRAEVERLQSAHAELERRIEQDFGDIRSLPADFSKKMKELDKLLRLQQSLDARRETLRQQLAEKQAQMDEELPEFTRLSAEALDLLTQRGQRDVVLLRMLVHLDGEILDRRRTESALGSLEASMQWLPTLPDGLPVWHKVVEEHRRVVTELEDSGEKPELSPEAREALLTYYVRSKERTDVEAELERARTHLASLDDELKAQGLPLDEADVNAWLTQQELTIALATEGEKKGGLLSLFGTGSDDAKDKLAAAQKERARVLTDWKLASADEVPALLAKDRAAREKLTSARARVDAAEAALEEFEDLAPPMDMGVEGPDDVFRVLAERLEGRSRRETAQRLLATTRASLEVPELPEDTNLQEAYERQSRLREEKTRLAARLEQLRPTEELEATREGLLAFAVDGLTELPEELAGDEGVRRLLRYQALHREIAELRSSIDQSSPGSKVSKLNEQLAQQRSQLESELGSVAAADQTEIMARWQELQDLSKELAELDKKLAAHSDETQESLDHRTSELQDTLRRLHVEDEQALGEALKRYGTYKSLCSELEGLKSEVEGALQRHLDSLADLESAVAPFGTGLTEAEPVVERWRAAQRAADELTEAEARLAELPTQDSLAGQRDALVSGTRERCRDLGVPIDSDRDLELLARWSDYATWRHGFAALAAEQERLLQPGPRVLATRLATLEAAIGLSPGADLNDARQDFLEAREARVRAEGVSARWMLEADAEQDRVETLAAAGLPVLDNSASASLQRYRTYARDLRSLTDVQAEVEAALEGETAAGTTANLEARMEALRAELEGHEGEDPAQAEGALSGYEAESARIVDLEMGVATLEADLQARQGLEQATRQVAEAEAHLGEWSQNDDLEHILNEYQEYSVARNEAYRLHHEVSRLPSVQDLSGRLEAVEQALADLPPDTAQQVLHEFFERCQARASDLVTRVTMGRARLQFDEDEVRVVPNSDVETAMSPRPGDLWWKLAVCLELGAQHPWPIVLDEPFSGLSTGDKMELSELLMEISAERQVIVLTSERSLALDVTHDLNIGSPAPAH